MTGPIEFWFDFSSPYAYFASETIEPLAREVDRPVLWRPFLLGLVFPKTGMAPLVDMPVRGDYARHDWDRIARLIGVPFNPPPAHPYAATKVSRAYYWIEASRSDLAVSFAHAVFRAHFAEGRDPSQTSVIAAIAEQVGLSASILTAAIQTDEAKAALRQRVDEAAERRIFGAPFFIVDGEAFWGWDRMPMMRDWIQHGGW